MLHSRNRLNRIPSLDNDDSTTTLANISGNSHGTVIARSQYLFQQQQEQSQQQPQQSQLFSVTTSSIKQNEDDNDKKLKNNPRRSKCYSFMLVTAAFSLCCITLVRMTSEITKKSSNILLSYFYAVDGKVPRVGQPISDYPGFDSIYRRSAEMITKCEKQYHSDKYPFTGFNTQSEVPFLNDTIASLPAFGIMNALSKPYDNDDNYAVCTVPPTTECGESQLTVVFMAYNPDRLDKTLTQMKLMMKHKGYSKMVREIVLVWNGPRAVNESSYGQKLLEFLAYNPVRIVYPLLMGFPNDLMNRYHPSIVNVSTKAILFYDDDGPFYSFAAIQSGFELWKRHSSAQIGAMAREITYSPKQWQEWNTITQNGKVLTDRAFVSHCSYKNSNRGVSGNTQDKGSTSSTSDYVDYNYRYFANYNANMVLPSGSILHSNYLCYLWHPAFHEIRQFVYNHPVHPDDMTVSMIVSQLSGRAPRVYSRNLIESKVKATRRLLETEEVSVHEGVLAGSNSTIRFKNDTIFVEEFGNKPITSDRVQSLLQDDWSIRNISDRNERFRHRSRKLMFKINWDAGAGMTEKKRYWASLRIEAINSLVQYFGSLNSGSIGWCEGTKYYDPTKKEGKCNPPMAQLGWLPWMKPDGTPQNTCP